MAIEGKQGRRRERPHPPGMVGGGQGAFIGAVHRIAARIDDQFELVAGALSSEPARAPRRRPRELGIADDRSLWLVCRNGAGRGRRAPTASRRWRS